MVSLVELFRIMTRFAELANPAIDSKTTRDVSSTARRRGPSMLTGSRT